MNTDKIDYRFYAFGNFYLSSIQQGIQSAHALGEMFLKYKNGDPTLISWVQKHKTMILKNGGAHDDLYDICQMFHVEGNKYPWAQFNEEEGTLRNSLTSVAIILPNRIYDIGPRLNRDYRKQNGVTHLYDGVTGKHTYTKDGEDYCFNDFEIDMINLLMKSRNAI